MPITTTSDTLIYLIRGSCVLNGFISNTTLITEKKLIINDQPDDRKPPVLQSAETFNINAKITNNSPCRGETIDVYLHIENHCQAEKVQIMMEFQESITDNFYQPVNRFGRAVTDLVLEKGKTDYVIPYHFTLQYGQSLAIVSQHLVIKNNISDKVSKLPLDVPKGKVIIEPK
eukprot:TRINITY_DN14748_c0_g1_i2.p1 TRINITY_DN14748_c0_g1~~TRINITY_DN14748_c0_g1_i2.p1  ORF type:complete len:173 (+),score=32.37 TRINITY_DN14748_c0_g1_i2:166-684(+)